MQNSTLVTVMLPDGTIAVWTLDLDEAGQDELTNWLEAKLGVADVRT